MPDMELTEKEKEMLQVYSVDVWAAREKAGILQAAMTNLARMALFARGLSPEEYSIDDKGVIQKKTEEVPPEKEIVKPAG